MGDVCGSPGSSKVIGAHCPTPRGGSSGLLTSKISGGFKTPSSFSSDSNNKNNCDDSHVNKLFFAAKDDKDLTDQDSAETSSQGSTENCSNYTPTQNSNSPSPGLFLFHYFHLPTP